MSNTLTLAQLRAQRHRWVIARDHRYNRFLAARRRGDWAGAELEHEKWRIDLGRAQRYNNLIRGYRVDSVTATLTVAVSKWEGLGPHVRDGKCYPYWDEIGQVWTIGFGHIEGVTRYTKPLTIPQAQTLLEHDLDKLYAPHVARYAKRYGLDLKPNEFDALTSFAYNLGPGYFERGHDIGDAMARCDKKAIADAILLYNHGGGGAVLGLTRRREWERNLFLHGVYKVVN